MAMYEWDLKSLTQVVCLVWRLRLFGESDTDAVLIKLGLFDDDDERKSIVSRVPIRTDLD